MVNFRNTRNKIQISNHGIQSLPWSSYSFVTIHLLPPFPLFSLCWLQVVSHSWNIPVAWHNICNSFDQEALSDLCMACCFVCQMFVRIPSTQRGRPWPVKLLRPLLHLWFWKSLPRFIFVTALITDHCNIYAFIRSFSLFPRQYIVF